MYRCDDWHFAYTTKEGKEEALQKYATEKNIAWNDIRSPVVKIPHALLVAFLSTGFDVNYTLEVSPERTSERYDPDVFLVLSSFLEEGSYMHIYNEENGESICWIIYQGKAQQLIAHWEVNGFLEEKERS